MEREPLEVDFVPDGQRKKPEGDDIMWSVLGALVLVLVIAVVIHLAPLLLAVLAVAAGLAVLSTWQSARRNERLRRLGWPHRRVGVQTYVSHLASWFLGLLAIVPLVVLGALAAVIGVVIIGAVAMVALIASLFR